MNAKDALCVFCGGVAGTGVRMLAGMLTEEFTALLFVNTLGSFLLALLTAGTLHRTSAAAHRLKLFAGTGLCGALTTQSAFAVYAVHAGISSGTLFAGLSLLAGIGAAITGWQLGSALPGTGTTPRAGAA